MENKNFSVKCCLLAFKIVVLGRVVSLELYESRASYHTYYIYPSPFFFCALLRESYLFLHQFG